MDAGNTTEDRIVAIGCAVDREAGWKSWSFLFANALARVRQRVLYGTDEKFPKTRLSGNLVGEMRKRIPVAIMLDQETANNCHTDACEDD